MTTTTTPIWEPQVYPLSIRDVPPDARFKRLEWQQSVGALPEGIHTGGVWYDPRPGLDTIWKPLDGRPYVNADCHVETREEQTLELMKGQPGFPINWYINQANGRRWLVRKRAYTAPPADPRDIFRPEHALIIEQGMRELNARGWELNDHVNVAIDPDTYEPFILDLSTAAPQPVKHFCNDEWRWERWAESMGFKQIVAWRDAAQRVVDGREPLLDQYDPQNYEYRHVYASYNRPFSFAWADTVDAKLVHSSTLKHGVHTWIVAKAPLDPEYCRRYELEYGWSPWGPNNV